MAKTALCLNVVLLAGLVADPQRQGAAGPGPASTRLEPEHRNASSKIDVMRQVESAQASPSFLDPVANIFPSPPSAKREADFGFFTAEGADAGGSVALDEPDEIDPGGTSDLSPYSLRLRTTPSA
jgi:hypothetical protein